MLQSFDASCLGGKARLLFFSREREREREREAASKCVFGVSLGCVLMIRAPFDSAKGAVGARESM